MSDSFEKLSEQELTMLVEAKQSGDWSKVPDYLIDMAYDNMDKTQAAVEAKPRKMQAGLVGAADIGLSGYAPQVAGGIGALTGGDYAKKRGEYSAFQNQIKEENPTEYLGGQIVGGAAQLFGPGLAMKGISKIPGASRVAAYAGNVASKIPGVSKIADYTEDVVSKLPSSESYLGSAAKSGLTGGISGLAQNTPDIPGEVTPFWDEKDYGNRAENFGMGLGFGVGMNQVGALLNKGVGGVERGWQALGPKAKFGKITAEAEDANIRKKVRDEFAENRSYQSPDAQRADIVDADFMDINQGQLNPSEEIRQISRNRDIVPIHDEKALQKHFKQNLDTTLSSEGITLPKNVNVEKEALPHIDGKEIERRTKGYDGRLLTQKNVVDYAQRTGVLKPGSADMLADRAAILNEKAGIQLSEAYTSAQNEAYSILRKQGVNEDKINLILNTKNADQLYNDISSALDRKFSISVNKQGAIDTIKQAVYENAPGGADSIIKLNKLKQVFAEEAEFVKKSSEMTNQQEVYKYATQLIDKEIKERLYVLDQITGKNYGKKIDLLNKDYSLSKTVADMTLSQKSSNRSSKDTFGQIAAHLLPRTLVNTSVYSTLSPSGRSTVAGKMGSMASNINRTTQSYEGYPMNMLADVETDEQRKAYEQSIQNSELPTSEKARRMVLLQKGKVFLGK